MTFPLLVLGVTIVAGTSVFAAQRTGRYARAAVAGPAVILVLHARLCFA
jgi:hypothetical protein